MSWADMADNVLQTTIGTFKTAGSYTRAAGGSAIAINGVFDKNEQAVDPQTGAPVDSFQPTFGIRLADLPAEPASGDTIVIATVTYRILASEEDGQGGSRLILNRTS